MVLVNHVNRRHILWLSGWPPTVTQQMAVAPFSAFSCMALLSRELSRPELSVCVQNIWWTTTFPVDRGGLLFSFGGVYVAFESHFDHERVPDVTESQPYEQLQPGQSNAQLRFAGGWR